MPRVSQTRTLAGSWALPASVMLVAAVAPFERALPGSVFGFTLTTVELAIVIALAIGAIAWLRRAGGLRVAHADYRCRSPRSSRARSSRRVAAPEFQRQRRSRRRAPGRRGAVVHPGCQRRQDAIALAQADRRRAPRLGVDGRRHRRLGARAGAVGPRRAQGVPPGLPRRRRTAARDVDAVLSNHHLDVPRGRVRARPRVAVIEPARVCRRSC